MSKRWTHTARPFTGAAVALAVQVSGGVLPVSGARVTQAPVGEAGAGWVGLRVDFVARSATEAERGRYTVIVGEVDPRSPASEAGLQPGDTLLLINGAPASPRSFQALRRDLRAGEPLSLRIRRDARVRDVAVVAGARPVPSWSDAPGQLVVRIDSLRTAILRNAQSLRGGVDFTVTLEDLAVDPDSFITVLEVSERGSVAVAEGDSPARSGGAETRSWILRFEEPGSPQPFATRLVRTPGTDSIRASIETLRNELELVARAEERRRQEVLRADPVAAAGVGHAEDAQLEQLEAVRRMLISELKAQEAALRASTEDALRSPPPVPSQARVVQPAAPEAWPVSGPVIAPYVVGRNYLAGAEIATLNERLATYFDVEGGVLVTDVVPGTPARDAGLLAGDVIVALDGGPVRTVEQLRQRVHGLDGVVITVVRKGETRSLSVGR